MAVGLIWDDLKTCHLIIINEIWLIDWGSAAFYACTRAWVLRGRRKGEGKEGEESRFVFKGRKCEMHTHTRSPG
jgi:hypothetical protein